MEGFSALIERGSNLEGNLIFDGNVRIAGKVKGDIFCNGSIYITEEAEVNANIKSDVVIIEGNVIGNIEANARVEIKSQAYFEGSVKAASLIIQAGATFNGSSETF